MLLGNVAFRNLCRAREIRMPPFHFIRQFEAVFGLTPHQFRIQSRLDRARLLPAKGEHSVTGVCREVGFEGLGSFSALVQVPFGFPQELFPGCLTLMGRLPRFAFRNFQEAPAARSPSECGLSLRQDIHANQTHQHHGR